MNSVKSAQGNLSQAELYWAKPASETGKGVLVLHAWWGLNAFIKGFCDRLSGEGFTVLAPDLYHGEEAAKKPEGCRQSGRILHLPGHNTLVLRERPPGCLSTPIRRISLAADSGFSEEAYRPVMRIADERKGDNKGCRPA